MPLINPIVDPEEIKTVKSGLSIRFDCLLRMYDFGQANHIGRVSQTKLPPQYFRMDNSLTMDFIESSSLEEIGFAIKSMYKEMKDHVEAFEKANR